jgi:hypothetical protein
MMEGMDAFRAEEALPPSPPACDDRLRWAKEDTSLLSNAVGGVSAHSEG